MNTTRLLLATIVLVTGCAHVPPPAITLDTEPARLVSAFFGLDNALPTGINLVCPGGGGEDGMPVTFSRRVVGAIEPTSFTVRTKSGALLHCQAAGAPSGGTSYAAFSLLGVALFMTRRRQRAVRLMAHRDQFGHNRLPKGQLP